MASSNNDTPEVLHAERVVIVTGPGFGTALGFIALGAAIGAGAFYALSGRRAMLPAPADVLAAAESESPQAPEARAQQFATRIGALSRRVKTLAGHAKEAARVAAETVGPVLGEAVAQGRTAARETEAKLHEDLEKAPEFPEVPEAAKSSDG